MLKLTIAHLKAVFSFDGYRFHLQHSLALTFGMIVPIIIGLYCDQLHLGISAAVGAILVGVFNPDEPYPVLVRSLFAGLICITSAAIIGMFVAPSYLLIVIVSALIAWICGLAGVLGPHAGAIGMLSLVAFCVFAGKVIIDLSTIFHLALAVFAGGLLQIAIAIRGWPFKTFYPIRRQLANAFYSLGYAAQKETNKLISPSLISSLLVAKSSIPYSGAVGSTAKWLNELADQCEVLRINFIQLVYRTEHEKDVAQRDLLKEYCSDLGKKVHILGETILRPKHILKYKKVSKDHVLKHREIHLANHPEIKLIEQAINEIHELLSLPFPIGKSSTTGKPLRFNFHPIDLIKNNIRIDNIFVRHATRLSIVIPLGWILSFFLMDDNGFWVPLTIAWIAKPDYVGTVPRVFARVIGTLLGAALTWLIIFTIQPDTYLFGVLIFVSAFAVYAYLLVNYAAAVFFITALALFLVLLAHPVDTIVLIDERIFATLIGGVLTLTVVNIKPIFSGEKIIPSFINLLDECKKYVSLGTADPEHILLYSQPVKIARLKTMEFIHAAKLEPHSGKLNQETAEKVLLALLEAMFNVLSIQAESAAGSQPSNTKIDFQEIGTALDLLLAKFKAIEMGGEYADNIEMKNFEFKSNNAAVLSIGKAYSYL